MELHYVLDIADGNHDLGERPARLIGPFDDFEQSLALLGRRP